MAHSSGSIQVEAIRKFQSEIFLTKEFKFYLKERDSQESLSFSVQIRGDLSMKKYIIRLTAGFAIAMILSAVTAVGIAADKKAPGDMVAVVNGTIITQGELDRLMDFELKRSAQNGRPISEAEIPTIKNSILDSLIVGELLFQESKKKGIKVKSEAVTEQLASVKKTLPKRS